MWICLSILIFCWALEFANVSGKTVDELQREVTQTFNTYTKYIEKIENKIVEQNEIITQLKEQVIELKRGMNSVNRSIYALEDLYELCPIYLGKNIRIKNGKCYAFLKDGGDSFENAMLKCDNFTKTNNMSNTVGADKIGEKTT